MKFAARIAMVAVAATLVLGTLSGYFHHDGEGAALASSQHLKRGVAGAKALGLKEVSKTEAADCVHAISIDDTTYYCLDGQVSSDFEAWEIWMKVRGITPTDADREHFRIVAQMNSMTYDQLNTAEGRALALRLQELDQEISG